METKPNDSVTPKIESTFDFADVNQEKVYTQVYQDDTGLTKREYFAAKALQGQLAHASWSETEFLRMARRAVRAADELIRALNGQ